MAKFPQRAFIRVRDYQEDYVGGGSPVPVGDPRQSADHNVAYWDLLYSTKEAAIEGWRDDIEKFSEGSPEHVRQFVRENWPDEELVCICYVEEDGLIHCSKRVALLSASGVEQINLDEDFLIQWSREEIFEAAQLLDDFPSAPSM
jgi:hypothetical protein